MEWSDRGQDNLTHAKRLHSTAIDNYRRNDLLKATHNLTEALRLRRAALPQSHPQIIATEEFLINLYHQQGLHMLELQHLRQLLTLKKARFGRFHVETEQTTTALSDLLASLGEKAESDDLAGEVWRMRAMPSTQRQALDFEEVLTNLASSNVRRADSKKLVDHFFGAGAEPKMRSSPFADDENWLKNLTERLQVQKQTELMFKQTELDEAKAKRDDPQASASATDDGPAEPSPVVDGNAAIDATASSAVAVSSVESESAVGETKQTAPSAGEGSGDAGGPASTAPTDGATDGKNATTPVAAAAQEATSSPPS